MQSHVASNYRTLTSMQYSSAKRVYALAVGKIDMSIALQTVTYCIIGIIGTHR